MDPGGGRRPVPLPDATYRDSSHTVFALTWGDAPPAMHPAVGERTGRRVLGELEVGNGGLAVGHPVFQAAVPDVPPGRYVASFASFVADAMPFGGRDGVDSGRGPEPGDGLSSVVTIWVHLHAGTSPTAPPSAPPAGSGACHLLAHLDELGLVLADPPEADRILAVYRDEIARCGGLLEAMETTYLGEDLVDSGAFLPVWGMRPWVYRVMTGSGTATLCPIGEPAGDPLELCASPFVAGARLVPGSCLRGTDRVEWRRWPLLPLPGTGAGLRVQAYVGAGIEPLMDPFFAGVLATLWVERMPQAPPTANSAHFPSPDFNPLEWVPADHHVQRVRRDSPPVPPAR